MQDRKEYSTGFIKNIKKKVRDWESRHLWTARIFVYSILFLLVISVGAILFAHFNLFHTDADSARYMLSALVQSQAAIVAIVITLTLIAVQLTASAYSPRVVDTLKKNPDLWILLGCYGLSIFYGFIVLKFVEGVEGEAVSQSAIWSLGRFSISSESCVSLAYWLGAFTFIALFPYMWNIISLLKSENIIKRLAIEITRDKILNSKEDPLQSIMDIVYGSILKYDLATTRVGLKAVTSQVIKIIGSDGEEEISRRLCAHLIRVSGLAVSREDVESTVEVIKNLENFGKSTTEKGLERATLQVAWSLRENGRTAAGKGLEGATRWAAMSLEKIGRTAAGKGLEDAAWQVAVSLGEVGVTAAGKGLEDAAWQVAMSLGEVGVTAAEKGFEGATWWAAVSLGEVGRAAAEKGFEGATSQAAESLGYVGRAAVEKELEDATSHIAMYLREVGRAAAEKGLGGAALEVAVSLGEVGVTAAEKGFEGATGKAAMSLGYVGRAAVEKGLGGATRCAAESLGYVGRAAVEKGLGDTTWQVAMSLVELTILSEEIVKTAIQNYESEIEEKDLHSFQKFMRIYEQELEKLRAEK